MQSGRRALAALLECCQGYGQRFRLLQEQPCTGLVLAAGEAVVGVDTPAGRCGCPVRLIPCQVVLQVHQLAQTHT